MGETAIAVEGLTKRYRRAERPAIDGVSFTVGAGEFFALLGPNGAGKTTTISVLTTTLAKTSGAVRVAGYDLDIQAADVRRSIGIIFQQPSIDEDLTAEENIRVHCALYGVSAYRPRYAWMPASYRTRVEELADLMGLRQQLHKKVKTFSGGMARKLEIIRSLMHRPAVLFLDEPTAGLDPVSRADLWGYLRQVRRELGTTVFLTTHYLEEAEDADRVCILTHGQIAFCDSPGVLKQQLAAVELSCDGRDRPRLRTQLAAAGLCDIRGDGPFHVTTTTAAAQHAIASITAPLTHFEVRQPTLEQVYIDLINESEQP